MDQQSQYLRLPGKICETKKAAREEIQLQTLYLGRSLYNNQGLTFLYQSDFLEVQFGEADRPGSLHTILNVIKQCVVTILYSLYPYCYKT